MNARKLLISVACLVAVGAAVDPRSRGFVGKRYPSEQKVYKDEKTGRNVVALTTSPADDDKIYQTHPSWTSDGKHIVFRSNRTGRWQLFAVTVDTGEIIQLTASPGVQAATACLSRKRNALITLEGNRIVLLDLERIFSGDQSAIRDYAGKTVGTVPHQAKLAGPPSWDAAEKVLYLGLEWPEQTAPKRWSIHGLDLATGQTTETVRQDFRIGHVQANPVVTGLVMYCQETGGDAPQRMWVVRADGTGNRPFYRETYGEWVTHEVWWDSTRALFAIWPRNEEMRKKPYGIASVDLQGNWKLHSRFPFWHVTGAPRCTWAVGDTFTGEIFRVDLDTGDRMLLTQGHRVAKRGTHPHPSLRPDGRQVLFVSHHFGSPDLFLVDVPASREEQQVR
jgi:oligogalacturonide lyase